MIKALFCLIAGHAAKAVRFRKYDGKDDERTFRYCPRCEMTYDVQKEEAA